MASRTFAWLSFPVPESPSTHIENGARSPVGGAVLNERAVGSVSSPPSVPTA